MTDWQQLALILLLTASTIVMAAEPAFDQQSFSLPANAVQLIVADTNDDNLQDLISVSDQTLRIYFQNVDGFDFQNQFAELTFKHKAVGWDLSRGYGNGIAIVALLDGNLAQAWHITDGKFSEPEVIQSGLPGFITKGVNRLHFSRDINNDGLEDLVIPGAGVINLLIKIADGSYQPPLGISSEMRLRTEIDINRFNRSSGQSVRIPVIELRDVNGDSANDLISRTAERLDVFIANPGGSPYLPRRPSYSLNIAAVEDRLGEFDIDNLDFSNLTGVLALTHEEILDDVNGDGIDDLLLREGGKVSLFRGNSRGMDLETPQQVLRSGGNVLSTFLHDEDGDGLKDLWLWRVEAISVGDIFVWMALSGSIGIEAFVYPNQGEGFSRRPTRKITVELRFPSVIRLASAYEDLSDEVEILENAAGPLTTTAILDDNLDSIELLALVDDQVQIFFDAVRSEPEQAEFLGALGYTRQRDNYTIDIREIIENASVDNAKVLEQVDGRQPDLTLTINDTVSAGDLFATRLNNDNVDDVFVFTHYDASQRRGVL
ncbi:MAG: VCBS repeat-containing protein, partial [Gammaproteobacteria bacterium]|nr:VCBS repeat-containing protein [Gammaproteobacteria bacterium]